MTLAKRRISVTLIDTSASSKKSYDRIDLLGHKVDVSIENPGGFHCWGKLGMRIFGMNRSDMNRFTILVGRALTTTANLVSVSAGDDESGMPTIFQGNILFCYQDFRGAPDVSLNITAVSALAHKALPAAPNGFNGSIDVSATIRALATSMGFGFKNSGVNVKLTDHYLSGTVIDQIRDLASAAGIMCKIENNMVTIWPNGSSADDLKIEVGPENGMVGYPTFTSTGLSFRTLFNPAIGVGSIVNLKSSIEIANGEWFCTATRHDLSTMTPDGPWYTSSDVTPTKNYVPAI